MFNYTSMYNILYYIYYIFMDLSTYNFSFWSSESLRTLFSNITLETSDETHTAIHWWDQPSLQAAVRHQMLCLFFVVVFFFYAHDKQEETHCLADDAGDAWFASEARQTLGTKRNRRTGSAWMTRSAWKKLQRGERDCIPEVTYSVSYATHRALQTPETTWALKTQHWTIGEAFKMI